MRVIFAFCFVLLFFSEILPQRAEDYQSFVNDGAWCWFSDPRSIYYEGNRKCTYTGYVNSSGDVIVDQQDHETGKTSSKILYNNLQKDDHVNPSLLVLPDGRIMSFFTKHNGTLYYSKTSMPEDIASFSRVDSLDLGSRLCYTNPALLSEENNRIYLFSRGGYDWKPSFITSDDLGETWSAPRTFVAKKINDPNNRPYVKVVSDGKSNIHFAFTDGHPREENHNSIYYLRLNGGVFYDAAHNIVGNMDQLPIERESVPKAYDGVANNQRAWIWDIALSSNQSPVIVYSTLPEETKHYYNYGKWNGTAWENTTLCQAGSAFPVYEKTKEERDPEPHYSGGIVLNHRDPSIVYLSRPKGDRFEIEKWVTPDAGKTFTSEAITSNSLKDNVRPFVVRNNPPSVSPGVLWMSVDRYRHYTDFATGIKGDFPADKYSTALSEEAIKEVMGAVASWQIDHFDLVKHHPLDWTNGALYKGMMEWAKIASDEKYMDWLYRLGHRYSWQPYRRMYHADDVVVCQMYLEMYKHRADDPNRYRILGPTQARMDYIMAHPSKGTLLINYRDASTMERWSWCDALFMAPPVFVQMAKILGEENYIEFMDKEYRATYEFLYDKEEHLFYRDHRYFPDKVLEANGKKVFWGRGNGWVMGGLVSILKDLPKDSPYRPFYETLYKEMAEKVARCQGEDGYWHASLLDPVSFPKPETSSSAFFTHALAYGVNAGLLDKEKYTPLVFKSWQALVDAVHADGKLGWVQPVGENPKNVTSDMTEVYGVGAFLLAGVEVLKMIQ